MRPEHRPHSPFLGILVLAAALRGYRLDAQSLWYDEGVSAFMTTRGPAEIALAAAADIHPPLYYWLLAAWAVSFGAGEVALRGLSVVLGTLTVWVVWQLGRRVYDDAVGLAAAALLAVSPLAVQYSQEVRMYALAGLLAAAATWAYLGLVRSGRPGARAILLYALLSAALIYSHYYGVLVLAAHQTHAAGRIIIGRRRDLMGSESQSGAAAPAGGRIILGRRRELLVPWLLASGLIAALYLPWLPYALRQTGDYPGLGTPQPPWALVLDAVNVLSLGIATTRFELRWALIPFLILALLGVAQRGERPVARCEGRMMSVAPLLALWLAIPIGGMVALSATRPLYEPRFLMLVLPAWTILVAAGGVGVGRAAVRWGAQRGLAPSARGILAGVVGLGLLGMLLVPTARSLAAYYFDPAYARDDYRGLARRIAELERPSDAIILTAPGQAEIFGYYYRGSADLFPLPTQRPIDQTDTLARLGAVADGHRRVWLVRWAATEADPDDLIGRWLRDHGRPALAERFGHVELHRYDLSGQAKQADRPDARSEDLGDGG